MTSFSICCKVTREEQRDLISVEPDCAVAHYNAEDMKMSAGIAIIFKEFCRSGYHACQQPKGLVSDEASSKYILPYNERLFRIVSQSTRQCGTQVASETSHAKDLL